MQCTGLFSWLVPWIQLKPYMKKVCFQLFVYRLYSISLKKWACLKYERVLLCPNDRLVDPEFVFICHAIGSIYILSLRPEFCFFWKKDFESSWSAYWPSLRPGKKTISCKDMSLLWNSWIFSMLVYTMTNNTQLTTNCTNLHPTPTRDPLAKVKLAFCTSS